MVGVKESVATVRYVLTSKGRISVGGVVASVCSSPLCPLEVAPFYFLDAVLPGVLQVMTTPLHPESSLMRAPSREMLPRLGSDWFSSVMVY